MFNKKNLTKIIIPILIIFTLILCNTIFIFYNDSFFNKEFAKNDVYNQNPDANLIDKEVRNYLVGKSHSIETNKLNEREKLHLEDVKNLVFLGEIIIVISIIILTIYSYKIIIKEKNWIDKFWKILKNALIFSLAITITAFIFRNSFDSIFTQFHKILFSNNLWMMRSTDVLIQIYPRNFFFSTTKEIVSRTGLTIIISTACLWIIKKNYFNSER